MAAISNRAALVALAFALASVAHAEPVPEHKVRAAMDTVEVLLRNQGIDVAVERANEPPPVELVAASHPYLQGSDGGYVEGRIYLNGEAIAACTDLTLLHELVHHVAVKHRLFATVDNQDLKDVFEALADVVTAEAAHEPYRPGCLPRRRSEMKVADLAQLATAQAPILAAAVPELTPADLTVPLFFSRGRSRFSRATRALLAEAACRVSDRISLTLVLADVDDPTTASAATRTRRARAVQGALARLGIRKEWIDVSADAATVRVSRREPPALLVASTAEGVGRGLARR